MNSYPIYPERRTDNLNGIWAFSWLGEDCAELESLQCKDFVFKESMSVPGAFDAGPKYAGKRGIGVYRKIVTTCSSSKIRLLIDGLGLRARIWWDQTEIALDELPYTSLSYDFLPGKPGVHTLTIACDNRFLKNRAALFHPNYDFYFYGGIYRSVAIQYLPDFFMERVQVRTLDIKRKSVELTVRFSGKIPQKTELFIAFDNGKQECVDAVIQNGVCVLQREVPNGKLWSPKSPHLHTVRVGVADDSIMERFGIRTVKTEQQKILLNGKPIYLQGFCRHEAHPELGPAISDQIMMEDIEYFKEIGANFVRCVHYPHSQSFFDLCDEAGLLVWEESLGWGDPEERISDPAFAVLQEKQTRQMIRNGINHPSILVWAFCNEGASHSEKAIPFYKNMIDLIHKEDPSRLASFASCRVEQDVCVPFVDVIAFNIYPGWMSQDWDHTSQIYEIKPRIDELAKFTDRPDLIDKPLILSEIGCCGLYGFRDRLKARWSEEYQAEHMLESCKCIAEHPRYSGVSLWQFYDTRTFPNGEVRCKGRGFNNAGVLDEYRRPKLAFDALKEFFTKKVISKK